MEKDIKEETQDTRPYWKVVASLAISLAGTALFLYFGYKLLGFFMPFVIGWLIASIASPVVVWLEKRVNLIKKWGSALIIIVVLGLVGLVAYLSVSTLAREVISLMRDIPDIYQDLESGMDMIGENLNGIFRMLPAGIQDGWHTIMNNLDKTAGDIIGRHSETKVSVVGRVHQGVLSVCSAGRVGCIPGISF